MSTDELNPQLLLCIKLWISFCRICCAHVSGCTWYSCTQHTFMAVNLVFLVFDFGMRKDQNQCTAWTNYWHVICVAYLCTLMMSKFHQTLERENHELQAPRNEQISSCWHTKTATLLECRYSERMNLIREWTPYAGHPWLIVWNPRRFSDVQPASTQNRMNCVLKEIALLSVMYPVGVGASGSNLACCHKPLVHYQIKTECITKSPRNGDRELRAGSCRKV
jgi:hypothetical protein